MRYKTISFGFLLAFLLIFVAPLSAIDIFTAGSGMILPESISMAPADFGNYAGNYIVPDHQAGKIWAIDPATGEASILTEGLENPLNGTFLPNDGYGDSSGRFVVSACDASTNAALWTVDSSGSKSLFTKVPDSVELYMLATPQIAPSAFASYGGSLFATGGYFDENWAGTSGVFRIDTSGNLEVFVKGIQGTNGGMPWGMTFFAPEGFGDIGGQMLVGVTNYTVAGKAESGTIYAVDSAGKFKLFAKVPFWSGEGFLAHMNFSPDYFGSANGLGESLFISIAGKSGGGGV